MRTGTFRWRDARDDSAGIESGYVASTRVRMQIAGVAAATSSLCACVWVGDGDAFGGCRTDWSELRLVAVSHGPRGEQDRTREIAAAKADALIVIQSIYVGSIYVRFHICAVVVL